MHDHHYLWPMFWGLFALAIILARRFTRHRERMRALDIAQQLAEKGVAAPELIAQALQREPRPPRSPSDDIRHGAILVAVAVGLACLGYFATMDDFSQGRGSLFHPLYGVATIPGLIGLVLIGFGLAAHKKV